LSTPGAEAGAGSWVQTDGTTVTVQSAKIRVIATIRKVLPALVDENAVDFTEGPPSQRSEPSFIRWTDCSLTIRGDVGL
jgi:hypothetical protein